MANPFKRGNTWSFYYYVRDDQGNRKQIWKGGYATRQEAEKELKQYRAKVELNQITYKTRETQTLGEYLEEWFAIHKQTLQPNTINGYSNNIYKHIIPGIGSVKLKNIKPMLVQSFYNDLAEKSGLSGKSIIYIHNTLKTALKAAVNEGYINENACLKVKPPKPTRYKPKVLTKAQIHTIMEYLKNTQYETEIKLAILLGLRRGEVLGIEEQDIDFERHSISIQRQVSVTRDVSRREVTDYYGIKRLKSESSNRELFLSDEIEQLLRRRILYNHQQRERLGAAYHNQGLICCKDNGDFVNPQTLYHAFKRALKACGLPNIRFHDLRHSYAILCIDVNVPIKVLSQALGHSSTAVTDGVYADSISAKRELANLISKAINE